MEILDADGRRLEEVTARLTPEEITELLLAASRLDDGSEHHAILRDAEGTTLALYEATDEAPPLARHVDWWLGPIVLLLAILLIAGAFAVARGVLRLLF